MTPLGYQAPNDLQHILYSLTLLQNFSWSSNQTTTAYLSYYDSTETIVSLITSSSQSLLTLVFINVYVVLVLTSMQLPYDGCSCIITTQSFTFLYRIMPVESPVLPNLCNQTLLSLIPLSGLDFIFPFCSSFPLCIWSGLSLPFGHFFFFFVCDSSTALSCVRQRLSLYDGALTSQYRSIDEDETFTLQTPICLVQMGTVTSPVNKNLL